MFSRLPIYQIGQLLLKKCDSAPRRSPEAEAYGEGTRQASPRLLTACAKALAVAQATLRSRCRTMVNLQFYLRFICEKKDEHT